jgi:hypothetical protein
MTREEVGRVLGQVSNASGKRNYYFDRGLAVDFGPDGTAEFIECFRDERFRVVVFGLDVFGTLADELVQAVSARYPFDPNDPELGWSYVFRDIDVALWRETKPERKGVPEGRSFDSIGVGVKGYYA